jgi:putative iron-regulated protein
MAPGRGQARGLSLTMFRGRAAPTAIVTAAPPIFRPRPTFWSPTMLNVPEEEQDCFSDNTHNSHYYDGVGIRNVYLGTYTRVDGTVVDGHSISDLVAAADPAVDAQLKAELDASVAALGAVKVAAENGLAYDQMLAPGNADGEALVMTAVQALVTQTASIERAATALDLSTGGFAGSDSLDNPNAAFQ